MITNKHILRMAALIVGVIVPLMLHAHTYAPNSVLQSGRWE